MLYGSKGKKNAGLLSVGVDRCGTKLRKSVLKAIFNVLTKWTYLSPFWLGGLRLKE